MEWHLMTEEPPTNTPLLVKIVGMPSYEDCVSIMYRYKDVFDELSWHTEEGGLPCYTNYFVSWCTFEELIGLPYF